MRISSLVIFLLCGSLYGQQQLDDGLYALLSSKKGQLVYHLDTVTTPKEVQRFLQFWGGELSSEVNEKGLRTLRFLNPKPLKIYWQIPGFAAVAGSDIWSSPPLNQTMPLIDTANSEVQAVLAFWQQRQQVRNDVVLFIHPQALLQTPMVHRSFAQLVTGENVLAALQDGDEVSLSELQPIGLVAEKLAAAILSDQIERYSSKQLWSQWLAANFPQVEAIVSAAAPEFVRDAWGFYIAKDTNSDNKQFANIGDSVEFSYQWENLTFADLREERSGLAIMDKDLLLPVVNYFLRKIPLGATWTILVPPWLNSTPADSKLKDSSWYRYRISVTGIF